MNGDDLVERERNGYERKWGCIEDMGIGKMQKEKEKNDEFQDRPRNASEGFAIVFFWRRWQNRKHSHGLRRRFYYWMIKRRHGKRKGNARPASDTWGESGSAGRQEMLNESKNA